MLDWLKKRWRRLFGHSVGTGPAAGDTRAKILARYQALRNIKPKQPRYRDREAREDWNEAWKEGW